MQILPYQIVTGVLLRLCFCRASFSCSLVLIEYRWAYYKDMVLFFYSILIYVLSKDFSYPTSVDKLSQRVTLINRWYQIVTESMHDYYRRMNQTCILPNLDKLVCKLTLNEFQPRSTLNKQTNFEKYNRSLYMVNCRSFRSNRPDRFKKHNNLVETNKENIMKLHTVKPRKESKEEQADVRQKLENAFLPQREEDIRGRHFIEMSGESLELLLQKKKMKNTRSLLGLNILKLEKQYNLSRFQLHTLFSTFNTLLISAKQSISLFRDNFEVILGMNKIAVRPQVLEKIFRDQQQVGFQQFIEIYGKIDELIFKQNIIDYLQILFQGIYNKDRIRFEDIVRIFRNRITESESVDVAKIIFEQHCRPFTDFIKLTEITNLCHCCENFSKKIYRIYTSELKCN